MSGDFLHACPVCGGSGALATPMGTRLKEVRDKLDMTQEQFARSLGMSRPSLANIEAGRQDVPTHFLVAVNRLYGVSVNWLLGLPEASEATP